MYSIEEKSRKTGSMMQNLGAGVWPVVGSTFWIRALIRLSVTFFDASVCAEALFSGR